MPQLSCCKHSSSFHFFILLHTSSYNIAFQQHDSRVWLIRSRLRNTVTHHFYSVILSILAIFLPPLAVFLRTDRLDADFIINVCLTILAVSLLRINTSTIMLMLDSGFLVYYMPGMSYIKLDNRKLSQRDTHWYQIENNNEVSCCWKE